MSLRALNVMIEDYASIPDGAIVFSTDEPQTKANIGQPVYIMRKKGTAKSNAMYLCTNHSFETPCTTPSGKTQIRVVGAELGTKLKLGPHVSFADSNDLARDTIADLVLKMCEGTSAIIDGRGYSPFELKQKILNYLKISQFRDVN